jgi:uncharacterized membrane protein
MTLLILGLLIFLGAHSTRIFADGWRTRQMARLGENRWKGLYALTSLIGFGLIVWGYGQTRTVPVDLWNPPIWTRHLAALLTVPAFVLLVAAYVRGSRIKTLLGHPMIAGVALWAFAHLLSNGRLGDVMLFGAFLLWALVDFIASRRRDRAAGTRYPAGTLARDGLVLVIGLVAWVAFVKFAHLWLIGVAPFG